ncbi:unnamed protein product [Lymnaea stagnalis]|uniref:diacylglycerol O-acyltransferase n=1 Tax=Lymnaea stagnalis TaxID=6523 RepID=A0AAV2I5M5_LYMST
MHHNGNTSLSKEEYITPIKNGINGLSENGVTNRMRSNKCTQKISESSTESSESDGQLCTEDHCVMSRKSYSRNCNLSQNSLDSNLFRVKRRSYNAGTLSKSATTNSSTNSFNKNRHLRGKLCHSCGGEMQRLAAPEQESKCNDFFSRSRSKFIKSLLTVVPGWLSEPEFMVHPKPNENKNIVHSHADSLFSTSSGFTNYYGILNLCLILLVLGNARLFLENFIKYGVLINLSFIQWFFNEPYNWPNLLLTLSIGIYPAIAYATEKLLAKGAISNSTGTIIYIVNLSVLLFLPAGVIYYLHPVIVFSLFTLGSVTVCFLKLISYAHVNYWCRECNSANKLKKRSSSGNLTGQSLSLLNFRVGIHQGPVTYPDNINVKDLAYFMFAPTLCYELNFPRSARIRKRFLAKRIIEMVFLCWLMVALMQQWIVPAVNNARQPLAEMEAFKMLERLLKLAIPNHLIWLVFFYWFFHSTLNVLAELLRFGDRVFYKDWWNAETVSVFWQHWNIPVHRFATRHIYKPLLSRGCPRLLASTIVFLLSAFFHEYLISVPLRMFKTWAFMGMLMQVPTAYITSKFVHGKWGNIIMWLSLILGQPVAILAYFHDYYIVHSLPLHVNSTTPNV